MNGELIEFVAGGLLATILAYRWLVPQGIARWLHGQDAPQADSPTRTAHPKGEPHEQQRQEEDRRPR